MNTTIFTTALILTAGLGTGLAQEPRTIEYHQVQTRVQTTSGSANGDFFTTAAPNTFFFESSEMAFDSAVVKGAPYSADVTTETTQTLADGNRIHRTTKAALYRDSEGRTRREQTLGEIGPLMASGEPIQTIVINDPVADATYMLNSRDKVAHKLPGRGVMGMRMAEMGVKAKKEAERIYSGSVAGSSVGAGPVSGAAVVAPHIEFRASGPLVAAERKAMNKESLGTQMIEGVAADGTRTTLTIPAGAMGNERPIEVVTETWYSSQLHTTVMTKTTDPRAGETIYSLKNIKLAEPAQNLFAVPADYTLVQ